MKWKKFRKPLKETYWNDKSVVLKKLKMIQSKMTNSSKPTWRICLTKNSVSNPLNYLAGILN